jgi:hypothetical protein
VAKVPRVGSGEEGEGEVGGYLERAGFRGRAVGRLDGDELVSVPTDEPEDCREAEGPEAADEPGLGDDAAEGGAGGGGAGEVGRGVEAQEDLCYGGPQVPEKGKAQQWPRRAATPGAARDHHDTPGAYSWPSGRSGPPRHWHGHRHGSGKARSVSGQEDTSCLCTVPAWACGLNFGPCRPGQHAEKSGLCQSIAHHT